MSMDRADALTYLRSTEVNALFAGAGRTLDDAPSGYGPVIDRAMLTLGLTRRQIDDDATPVADGLELPLMAALEYFAYTIVLPFYELQVDAQVDAPLTDVKLGRRFDHIIIAKKHALDEMAQHGFGPGSASFHRWNLDFLELNDAERGLEYGTTRQYLGFPTQ